MVKKLTTNPMTLTTPHHTWAIPGTRLVMACLLVGLMALVGCGSGSGSKTETNVQPIPGDGGGDDPFVYTGTNPAATEDTIRFQKELWEKIAGPGQCGGCHTTQAPHFARADDINLAYQVVFDSNLVNLGNPEESRLVTKVANGHNCWVPDATACGDFIAGWIRNWAGDNATQSNSVVLTAPAIKDIASSKSFPADSDLFATTVYPLLGEYCAGCHAETAASRQQPYLASRDIEVAYQAAKAKIRLDAPASSRLVQRLSGEAHNCWSDCNANAATLAAAISAFANGIEAVAVDPTLVTSKAVGLADAFVLTSGGRIDSEIIVKYEFKSGKGSIAYDSTGSGIDLLLHGNVDWSSAWGVKIDTGGRLQASTSNTRRLTNNIMSSGAYTIETWVIPDSVDQGTNNSNPARIVTLSGSATERNLALGQYDYNYSFLNRTNRSDTNGLAEIHTPDNDQVLQASLQHLVASFDPINGRRLFVNGEPIAINDPDKGAVLRDWDSSFALAVGNEVTGASASQWRGSMRFLAIHKRALSASDIKTNYDVGVGARYLLLFSIAELINLPESYIVFEVQQLDDYGYLFSAPFFTNLDQASPSAPIPLQGLRIGVNGSEAATGQVFANLDTHIEAGQIVDGRQGLARLGTIVEVKAGPAEDVFFLSFDRIGSHTHLRTEAPVAAPAAPAITPEQAQVGLRDFASINATLSALTTVPSTQANVAATYANVEQQLPTRTALDGFLAAHQMGITQLTVAYCNELVDNPSLRASYFPGFTITTPPASAFDAPGRSLIIEPLLTRLLANELPDGTNPHSALTNQAAPDTVRTELNHLIDTMTACTATNTCAADRTATTVKAVCAASLSSAVMLVQ